MELALALMEDGLLQDLEGPRCTNPVGKYETVSALVLQALHFRFALGFTNTFVYVTLVNGFLGMQRHWISGPIRRRVDPGAASSRAEGGG